MGNASRAAGLLDVLHGQNYLVGASAHMIPGAVGQHRIFVDTSADFSRFKPATTELVVL
jgi:hypothetical protein